MTSVRLSRSHSNSSSWLPDPAHDPDRPSDQRRIRHLTSIQIRNLTLNPVRDHLSSLLHAPPPASSYSPSATSTSTLARSGRLQFASDDTDLYLRTRRRRATSNASLLGTSSGGPAWGSSARIIPLEWQGVEREGSATTDDGGEGAAVGPPKSRTIARSSSGGIGGTLDVGGTPGDIKEEMELPSPPAAVGYVFPTATTSSSPEASTSSFGAPHHFGAVPVIRRRSTSRASFASVGTGDSGSTIRAVAPRVKEATYSLSIESPEVARDGMGRMSYTSEAQLAKEKERRAETLRRRLVDSFVTLAVVPPSPPGEGETGRKRVGSGSSMGKGKLGGSDGLRGRHRTLSSPTRTSAAPPFFVSEPQLKTTHPVFAVDRGSFLVEDPDEWEGMGQGRVLVGVWTRGGERSEGSARGKGKEKEVEPEWKLLVEWDVDFDGLVSLGTEPSAFPSLPPNSLVFTLHDEYFSAPLPTRSSHGANNPYGSDSDSSFSDDGNLSDPGTVALVARKKRRDEEEELKRKRRVIVEKSVRETRMVKPASPHAVLMFLGLQRDMEDTRAEIAEWHRKVDAALDEPNGVLASQRETVELGNQVDDLKGVEVALELELARTKAALQSRREALQARRGRLEEARELNELNCAQLAQNEDSLSEDESICQAVLDEAQSRRTQLITLLSHIFPIDLAPEEDASSSLLFTILSLPLPNSSYPPGLSDDTISSALGYTSHVVATLSAYLGVPLHYPIQCQGSRSAVMDLISVMRGPRAFPLYGKGVDRYRFDYGVFLLNKNIEQLMYSQGLTVIDLRNTLPNLKALILSLSYDPSHADFSSSTLTIPPLFAPPPFHPPLPFLVDDILDDFSPRTTTLHVYNNDDPPPSPSESESDDEDDPEGAGEPCPRSPSTLKAVSVRSASPVPTLKDNNKPNGTSHTNGNPVIRVADAVEKGVTVTPAKEGPGKVNGSLPEVERVEEVG